MKRIYVVWDTVALAVVSSLLVYAGDAAAVRAFGDALSNPESPYHAHPKDFELWFLGDVLERNDGPAVRCDSGEESVVLTGEQWVMAQRPSGAQLDLLKEEKHASA